MEEKNKFMKQALKEAKKAYEKLEVPVGAVIVKDGKIIAKAHNLKETKTDTTKHTQKFWHYKKQANFYQTIHHWW